MMRNTFYSNTFVSVMGTNQTNIVSFPKKNLVKGPQTNLKIFINK